MKATSKNPYPRTFEEFLQWFVTEKDCPEYLLWVQTPSRPTRPLEDACGAMRVLL